MRERIGKGEGELLLLLLRKERSTAVTMSLGGLLSGQASNDDQSKLTIPLPT